MFLWNTLIAMTLPAQLGKRSLLLAVMAIFAVALLLLRLFVFTRVRR